MAAERPIMVSRNRFSGDDLTFLLLIHSGPPIVTTASVADGATSIPVKPLNETIASGARVRFGAGADTAGVVVTLSAAADYGASSLAITAIDGNLQQGELGRKCQNMTGWVAMEFAIYDKPGGSAILAPPLTVGAGITLTTLTEGLATVVITDTQSAEIGTTPRYYRARRLDDGFEVTVAFGDFVLRE